MNELIGMITSQLGVNQGQAEGGVGAMLNFAKEKLSDGDFGKISETLGNVTELMGKAPEASGAGGLLGSVTSALGIGGNLGALASVASAFKSLDLDAGMITKFAPIVMGFLKDKGGDSVANIVSGLFE